MFFPSYGTFVIMITNYCDKKRSSNQFLL
jgi:hypothetical protein